MALVEPRAERLARRYGWVALVAGILVAYANSFSAPFVFDGLNYLLEAETVRDISSWEKILTLLDKGDTRALAYLSFGIDHRLYGYDVRGWHATSTLIHVLAALALYGVARHGFGSTRAAPFFADGRERMALCVALLWGVHPLNTQSVTYLYQRQESLMGMFYLLTLYAFTRWATTGRRRWAAASVAACTAGMASKEVMITAPLVVLWYDRVFCARTWAELGRRRGLYYLALAGTWSLLFWLMARFWGAYAAENVFTAGRVTPAEYGLTQLGVIARYLRLALVPYGLNIDYGWQTAATWRLPAADGSGTWLPTAVDAPALARSLVVVGGSLLFTVLLLFRAPALGFLAGAFFLVLAPTSSVVPIVDPCFEHRTYAPLAPLVVLLVAGAREAWRRVARRVGAPRAAVGPALAVAAGTVAAALVTLTLVRNHDYRSAVALWGDSVAKAPWNPRGRYNFGVHLQLDGQIEAAIEQYQRCVELDPNYTDGHLQLGRIALSQGRTDDAARHYQALLDTPPVKGRGQHMEALFTLSSMGWKPSKPYSFPLGSGEGRAR
jgi:hypothetical protein